MWHHFCRSKRHMPSLHSPPPTSMPINHNGRDAAVGQIVHVGQDGISVHPGVSFVGGMRSVIACEVPLAMQREETSVSVSLILGGPPGRRVGVGVVHAEIWGDGGGGNNAAAKSEWAIRALACGVKSAPRQIVGRIVDVQKGLVSRFARAIRPN